MRLGLLAMLCACTADDKGESGPVETGETSEPREGPWSALEPVALDPFRELAAPTLSAAEAPSRIRTLPARSLSFVLDEGAALVLDARYHHDPSGRCVDASLWPDLLDEAAQGDCPAGQSWTQRGRLMAPAPAVDLAVDAESLRLGLLTRQGGLALANADVLSDNPLHWLRLADPVSLETGALSDAARLALDAQTALVADGGALWALDPTSGAAAWSETLPGEVQAVLLWEGAPWALTDAGLWVDGELLSEVTGSTLVAGPDAVWVGGEGALSRVDPATLEVETLPLEGALGPLAPESAARLWAATSEGVALVEDGAEAARHETEAVVDLAMNSAGELVVLHEGGRLSVRVDETQLEGAEPLDVGLAAFIERPRGSEDVLSCEDNEDNVREFALRAARNHPVLLDQPLPVALGVTPLFARRATSCRVALPLRPLLDDPGVEVGVLFHDQPADCADADCLATFLASEEDEVRLLGVEPAWSSGLSPMDELGIDWVGALQEAGGPAPYLFFSLSILPDMPHEGDPRGKEPFPLAAGARSPAWRASSVSTLAEGDPEGWLRLYPGDSTPAFNLGDCPNLLLKECHLSAAGGLSVIDGDDIEALRLSLHRALAERDGVSTWTFHLPDLGVYEYSEGCDVQDRIWSGEGCQAALIQSFGFEVWQRYVLGGLVRLRHPSELEAP